MPQAPRGFRISSKNTFGYYYFSLPLIQRSQYINTKCILDKIIRIMSIIQGMVFLLEIRYSSGYLPLGTIFPVLCPPFEDETIHTGQ